MRNWIYCPLAATILASTAALATPAGGAPSPGDAPTLFAPDLVSDGLNNRDLTLAPDGSTLFTSVMMPRAPFGVILMSRAEAGRWSELEVAPFSGRYSDIEPMFAPDGRSLYFASRRPLAGTDSDDWNIWRTERGDMGWSEPMPLPAPINTAEDEFYPSVSMSGTLYFTSGRAGGEGREDIYRARLVQGNYTEPENLGPGVNSEAWEFNAFVAPDESYLLFTSQGRTDDQGGGDLYISRRGPDGSFLPAVNLGPSVNSDGLDYCPFVTADGSTLYFSSNRASPVGGGDRALTYSEVRSRFTGTDNGLGNIYWLRTDKLPQMHSKGP